MLPENLKGIEENAYDPDYVENFLQCAAKNHPDLDPDFVLDCCLHHRYRFEERFPDFNIQRHTPRRKTVTTEWVRQNVRFYNDRLDTEKFYGDDIDTYLSNGRSPGKWLIKSMLENGTWPKAPIIVSNTFAIEELGAPHCIGDYYHLFEGTRRISGILRMQELGIIDFNSKHEILELTFKD